MNLTTLLSPIPLLYRWLAIAALVAAFGAYCGFKGYGIGMDKLRNAEAKALLQGARIVTARAVVTERIVLKYLPAIVQTETITETITKEVPIYVPSTAADLPGGFRLLHDAAATGSIPDAARIPDAAAVAAQDVASTVAQNYGACRKDQLMLKGLQEWVAGQGKVK
jgi:hypothetical protein